MFFANSVCGKTSYRPALGNGQIATLPDIE